MKENTFLMRSSVGTGTSHDEDRLLRVQEIDRKIRAASARRTLYGSVLASKLKLNQVDLECLFIITLNDDVTPGELARETGLTTGAITGLVDRIERAGFITRQRDPHDRRRVILQPVPDRVSEIRAINAAANRDWLEVLAGYGDDALDLLEDFAERDNEAAIAATTKLQGMNIPS